MRLLACAILLGLAAPARAAEAPPLTAVLPPAADEAAAEAALLVQARAVELLAATGRYDQIDVKQILRMAEHEGLDPARFDDPARAQEAAKRLGAPRAVAARLAADGDGWRLTARLVGADKPPLDRKLPRTLTALVTEGGAALAGLVAGADGVTLPARPPWTASEAALSAYGACYAILVRQPIGIENPTVLGVAEIGRAIERCKAAVAADGAFVGAWAALGLAQAIGREDHAAVKAILQVKDRGGDGPLYWLARYWLVTRFQSSDEGLVVLEQAIKQSPGFLLARGYQAEHLGVVRRHGEALEAWRAYLARVPKSAFVRGRISKALARLGRHDEALAEANQALALDPTSHDARLELGSRHLDAGRPKEAIATFLPLAGEKAHGELLVRLGYAQLLAGDLTAAEATLRRALAAATHPSEWRTRGRAHADLARLYLKRGQPTLAEDEVAAAQQADLLEVLAAQNDPALTRLVERARRRRTAAKAKLSGPRLIKPTELSPFVISASGEPEIGARPYGKPPPSVELLRF